MASAEGLQSKYIISELIGSGSTSSVFRIQDRVSMVPYACKVVSKSIFTSQISFDHFLQEVKVMQCLSHPNIVGLYDFIQDDENFYMIMEYCEGGDLHTYISTHGFIPEQVAALIFTQLLNAIYYCHQNGICHRDIKPENILITNFPYIKLSDFGACGNFTGSKFKTFCGSPCFSAPERIRQVDYDGIKSDIYSLGVTLFCIVTGEYPWDILNTPIMNQQILSGDFEIPDIISNECASLIKSMMSLEPNMRPKLSEIFNSEWVRKIRSKTHLSNSAPQRSLGIPRQTIQLYDFIHQQTNSDIEGSTTNQKIDQFQTSQIPPIPLSSSIILNSSDHFTNYPQILKPIPISQSAVQAHEVSSNSSHKIFPVPPKVRRSSFGVHGRKNPVVVLQNLRSKQAYPSILGRRKESFHGCSLISPNISIPKEPLGV